MLSPNSVSDVLTALLRLSLVTIHCSQLIIFARSLGRGRTGSILPWGWQSIRNGRGFVAAAQNRVMQIGRVSFSGIKGYDHSLTFCIYPNVAHSRDAHERFAQFADAFIAIFAFRRDRDSLQHRFVWPVRLVRVGWIEMLGIGWTIRQFTRRDAPRQCPS